MELIESRAELLKQGAHKQDDWRHIELCGRVCYKSEGKITPTSWRKFTDMLRARRHLSPLEHGTVYMLLPRVDRVGVMDILASPYTSCRYDQDGGYIYATTNRRVIEEATDTVRVAAENYIVSEPMAEHDRRYTMHVICDRATSHELVRHRAMSFSQESTRYCDYQGGLQFIIPARWYDYSEEARTLLMLQWSNDERVYIELRKLRLAPQDARCVLPHATKTEMYITGYLDQWVKLIADRTAAGVHADAVKVAKIMAAELYNETKDERFKINL